MQGSGGEHFSIHGCNVEIVTVHTLDISVMYLEEIGC